MQCRNRAIHLFLKPMVLKLWVVTQTWVAQQSVWVAYCLFCKQLQKMKLAESNTKINGLPNEDLLFFVFFSI